MTQPSDPKALKARLEELADHLGFEVTVRPMMGGYIGYADDRPFVSLSCGGFGIKLMPPDQLRLLQRSGTTRQQHGPDEPPSKSYITISPDDLADDDQALAWLRLAAETAPARSVRDRPRRRG